MEDAVATALHAVLPHLEQSGCYAQLLFVDFSSVFNTILPHILVTKLSDIELPHAICQWIKDFLRNHTQKVNHLYHEVNPPPYTQSQYWLPTGSYTEPPIYTLYTHEYVYTVS